MTRLALMVFIGSAAWLAYVYAGYPICLWFLALFRRVPHVADDSFLPPVSVLIAARNEEKDIGWKVQQTLAWDYPRDRLQVLVASDASDDRTDEVLRGISDPRLVYVRMPERGGKVRALNHLARLATGELLFFTDANSDISAEALRRMVRHFADPRVGCVTGVDRTAPEDDQSAIGSGESTYWTYELKIDELESRLGSVLVCFGAIHCIRRELYRDCDPDLANDLEVPIRIGAAGRLLVFEPDAVSTEKATKSPVEEFKRRRRICGQGALGFWRLRRQLRGLRAWQFLSRKFLRWLALVPLAGCLLGTVLLAFAYPWMHVLLACQAACYLAGAVGYATALRGRNPGRLFAIPLYFILVNTAAFLGVLDACRGRTYAVWKVASLTRGKLSPSAAPQPAESDVLARKTSAS